MAETEKPKKKQSTLSTIAVWGFLGLLLIGLGGFGVTGFGTQVDSVGEVGDSPLNAANYHGALRQQLQRLEQQAGESIPFDQAEAMGLTQAVLQQQIAAVALQEAARRADLSVGDDEVARRIRAIPGFQGLEGGFDEDTYKQIIERSGRSVTDFEDSVRGEASAELLLRAMLTGLVPPATYGETLLKYIAESRTITWAEIPADLLAEAPAAPTEAEVQAYYNDNTEQFTLPERKELTYAWLSPAMLAHEVELSEDELRSAYEEAGSLYNRPERRMVDRLGFANEAEAAAALAAIDAGETTFDALVEERGLSIEDVDLGAVSDVDLTAEAAAVVFALDDIGIAGPAPSATGPALFRVNAILSAQSTSFEDARADLQDALSTERAAALVGEEMEPLDDLLAGGATLEELAADTPMELGTLTWRNDTLPPEAPANLPEFINAALAVTDGDFPEIILADGGVLFALRLDEVKPSELQPLDDVHAEAETGAADAKLGAALAELAERLKTRADAGEPLAALGLEAQTRADISRQTLAFDLPAPILEALFEMERGAVQVLEQGASVWLVKLDAITPPNADDPQLAQALARLTVETQRAIAEDIRAQFANAIAQEAGISLNQNALNAVHSSLR